MEKHYINDCSREELMKFLYYKETTLSTEFLRRSCIRQLLHDHDADKYELIDGILYVRED